MKQLILISLLLLAFTLAFADTYVIGTGTSASGLYPTYGYNDYGWSKQIYTTAEINAAGLNEATDISGIGIYVGNTPASYVMTDQRIYLRHTTGGIYGTATDETGTGYPDNTGFLQVFQGTLTFNGGGWHYIMFDTNFPWDNSRNIEVLWENRDGSAVTTGYPTFRYTGMGTGNFYNVYKNQNTSFPTTVGTRSVNRSNITIITPSTDPPNPAIIGYPLDNGWAFTDATLSWSDGGGLPTSYDVFLGQSQPLTLVGDDLTTTTYTPTVPLTPGTPYMWQVVPRNGNGETQNCPVWHFNTPTATQLAESFDTLPFPPLGWTNPGTWSRSTTTPFYGAATAYKSASTTPSILSGPLLAINPSSVLDFYYRTASTTGYGLMNIKYSSNRVDWSQIGATISMPTTTTWNNATVNLGSIPAGNYYIGFEVFTSTSTSSIYIDHVFGPECANVAPGPVTLTAPAEGVTGVSEFPTFTWTAPVIGGMPRSFTVYCDTNPNPVTPLATVTGLTYTATVPLPYNLPHYWKVVAYNGALPSVDNPIGTFTTREDPTVHPPWSEDFGVAGATFPPTNWTRWSGVIADPSVLVANTSLWIQDDWQNITAPVNKSARMNIYSTARYGWLITPPIALPGAGYQLEFDIALTDYSNSNPISSDPNGLTGVDDKFIVLIGNGGSWTPANIVRQWDNAGSSYVYNEVPNTGMHVTLPLDGYTGSIYVAFYGESTVSNADNDFFVDNVIVRQAPVGYPDHVTLTSPANGTPGLDPENLLVSWEPALTGGTADFYEVLVGEFPIDPGSSYFGEYAFETALTSLNLSEQDDLELGYGNTWYWAVLPYNGDPLQSPDPNDPEFMIWSFTTAPDPTIVELPHQEYFDSVTTPNLPWGWKKYLQYTTGTPNITTTTTTPVSAPYIVYMTNSTDAAATVILVSPPFAMPIGTIKTRFYARSGTAGQTLLIGAMDANRTTFVEIGSVALTTTNTQYSLDLSSYLGAYPYIGFKHGLGATSRSIYIDNVEFIELVNNDLAAISVTGSGLTQVGVSTDYVITVKNEGLQQQNAYDVNLKRRGDDMLATVHITVPIDAGATAQHTLSWIPGAPHAGNNLLYGEVVLAGDATPGNDESPDRSVYVVSATTQIVGVGNTETTTTANSLPLNMYYKNSVTECLYFYDETHMISGTIDAIVYKNSFTQDLQDKQVKIWMGQNTLTDLTGGWVPAGELTPVFDGIVDFPIGVNEVVIPLQNPYPVTAGNNVLIRVNRPIDTAYFLSTNTFYYTATPAHTSRARYLQSDTVTYDPLAPSAAGTTLSQIPNTWMLVSNAVMAQEAILEGYVRDTLNQPIVGATVTLTERVATTTNETGFYQFRFWTADSYDATASMTGYYSQTVTNITTVMGSTITQNFVLTALPRVTLSGTILANDVPTGLVGADVSLNGAENYATTTGVGGVFSIPNVLGHVDGSAYTLTVEKEGYQTHQSTRTVYGSNLNVGTITLNEYAYPAYSLEAEHSGADQSSVLLNWDAAGPPSNYTCDFETDNGGWVPSANWGALIGDWEWTNTYNVANYVVGAYPTSEVPPPLAHSGDGLWGTKIYAPYTNSGGFSYLTQTFDFSDYTTTQLRVWSWNNLFGSYDYGQIRVNGTIKWGPSTAVNNSWQEIVVDLSMYDGNPSVVVQFEAYATTVVNYAGWYIDDIYIGPATGKMSAQLGTRNSNRIFLNYDVYRMLAADSGNPAAWTLLTGNNPTTSYEDTAFGALPANMYKWAVKANYSGGLESAPVLSNNLGRVYSPDDVEVSQVGNNITIGWQAQPGADYYKIYGSQDPDGPFVYVGWTYTTSYQTTAVTARNFFIVVACTGNPPD